MRRKHAAYVYAVVSLGEDCMRVPYRHSMPRSHHDRAITIAIAASMMLGSVGMTVAMPSTAYAVVNQDDVILGTTVSSWGAAITDYPDISAPSAIMIDADGNTLFERGTDVQRPIASITKVMTAYIAVSRCADSLDDIVTIGNESASVGGSTSGLKAGDTITLRNLLLCAMLPSGNDAADAIARYVGTKIDPTSGNPYATFVSTMNDTAQSLGMTNTVYRNPHGLDVEQYAGDQHSTARDVSKLLAVAMKDDTFRWAVSQQSASVDVQRNGQQTQIQLKSTDTLLGSYNGAIGIKTGTTQAAGSCFAGAMNDGTKEIYTVTLGGASHDSVMSDTKVLYDWAQRHDVKFNVGRGHDAVQVTLNGEQETLPLMANVSCTAWTDRKVKATLADATPISTYDVLGNVQQHVDVDTPDGAVHVGDKVGTVTYTQGDTPIAERDLIAAEDVPAPNEIEQLVTAVGRALRTVRGEQTCAQSEVIEAHDNADDAAFTDGYQDDVAVVTRKNTNREPSTTITIDEK